VRLGVRLEWRDVPCDIVGLLVRRQHQAEEWGGKAHDREKAPWCPDAGHVHAPMFDLLCPRRSSDQPLHHALTGATGGHHHQPSLQRDLVISCQPNRDRRHPLSVQGERGAAA